MGVFNMDALALPLAQSVSPQFGQPVTSHSDALPPNFAQAPVTSVLPGEKPATPVKTRRGGREAKVKRGKNSVRPGQLLVADEIAVPVKIKSLAVLIPSDARYGKLDEYPCIFGIASQLGAFPQIGNVTSISAKEKAWEIVLTLAIPNGIDDDTALSEVFRTLMPTIEASPELRNGFRVGTSSKWEFRVGTFVADSGGF
jgi:hypothetical protein